MPDPQPAQPLLKSRGQKSPGQQSRFTAPEPGFPTPTSAWAIFLDIDGTLVEIAETPQGVRVSPALIATLESLLRASEGAVALVSGRSIETIDRLFSPLRLPVAGLHGCERRSASGEASCIGQPPDGWTEVCSRLFAFARARPGVSVEDKRLALAVHYRGAPGRRAEILAAVEDAAAALGPGVQVLAGKMVFELRPSGVDKGAAIEAFMAEPPFHGRTPVFIGDDLTDEDGFAVVNRMGGHSIRVDGDWPTHARWQVDSVAELLDWLAALPGRLDLLCPGGAGRQSGASR
jgi:trehalose 6-phosphate phosphatase